MELSNYKVLSVIGSGSFGICYKVQDKISGKMFAWKAVDCGDLKESTVDSLISEINLMRQLKHPNIVEYFDHIVNKETKIVYIVMECCDGGDLSQLISKCRSTHSRFEEKFIWRVLYQVCKALQLCHNKMSDGIILHRDIKPANIFLDSDSNVKLGDFGLARFLRKNEDFAESFVGTPYYMSPEIIKEKKYDRKSDIWSVGCLIYEMSTLNLPFRGYHFDQLSKNITEGKFANIPICYSSDLQDAISFMLNVNRDSRPTIELILRNPILVRNVPSSKIDFPIMLSAPTAGFCQKLDFSPKKDLSSTTISRFLSSTGTSKFSTCLSRSYESIRVDRIGQSSLDSNGWMYDIEEKLNKKNIVDDPDVITQNIFNQALQGRLQAIRAHETLLKQKESELDEREKQLNEREKRLTVLDKALNQKKLRADSLLKKSLDTRFRKIKNPVRKVVNQNDTYCSIESNESMVKPTVAKLDLAVMPPPKSLTRKVTFKSPQKFIKYNIENIPPPCENISSRQCLKSSTSSKTSDGSDNSHKRKSILSMFGINNQKVKDKEFNPRKASSLEIIDTVEPSNLAQMWTRQNKKAAFTMLAAMKAEDKTIDSGPNVGIKQFNRNKNRRSVFVTSKEKRLL